MKIIFTLLVASFSLLLLSHCGEEGGTMKAYFWTRHQSNGPYFLYINDSLQGTLPYLEKAPKCGEGDLDKKTRFVLLTSRTHIIEVRDQQGNIKFWEKYGLKKNANNISLSIAIKSANGTNHRDASGDCTIEEIGF
ncbi:hypothetical protein [Chitinophaga sp. RAB17]|uniref:hypothetical protein n=1 Tax=Chitinophaga sp. RAB17 TaxID=3233049 RepID=UPI003F922F24